VSSKSVEPQGRVAGAGLGGWLGEWRERLRALHVLLVLSFRADPVALAQLVAADVAFGFGNLAATYGLKLLTDGAIASSASGVLFGAAVIAGCRAGVLLAAHEYLTLTARVIENGSLLIDRRLMKIVAGLPGVDHHERPDHADQLSLVRTDRRLMAEMPNATVQGLRVAIELVGGGMLLALVHPLLVLLPLCGLAPFLAGRAAHHLEQRVREAFAPSERLRRHLFDLCTTAGPGKELRLFGLAPELLARDRASGSERIAALDSVARQGTLLASAGVLLFAAGYASAIGLVLWRALAGEATPGDLVLTVALAAQVGGAVVGAAGLGGYLVRVVRAGTRYLWLVDHAAYVHRGAAAGAAAAGEPAHPPVQLREGISLEDVSFRYPGTDQAVLAGVSLRLPAGAVVALVGDNGAGKSTLAKLLGRFYEPEGGRILVDGLDMRRFDVDAWRERTSAAFQDFQRFELLAREAVAVGDLPRMEDPQAVSAALARAGATEIAESLPSGLETQLGTAWPQGVDLSGGQWQRLALARAFMREAPLLVVLDEPTAAIDAQTEHALFERVAAAARNGASKGTVTLLVSHRFSTVRMADLIVVLDGGRVCEQGSHEELMRHQGLYAELYSLQASAYR